MLRKLLFVAVGACVLFCGAALSLAGAVIGANIAFPYSGSGSFAPLGDIFKGMICGGAIGTALAVPLMVVGMEWLDRRYRRGNHPDSRSENSRLHK